MIYIIATSKAEAEHWAREHRLKPDCWKFLSDERDLYGTSNPLIIRISLWLDIKKSLTCGRRLCDYIRGYKLKVIKDHDYIKEGL